MINSALEVMHARRSIREFEPELVPADVVRLIVEAAGRAPSSKNTQPWRLYLVQGSALESLRADYLAAFDAGRPGKPGYQYSPSPLPECAAPAFGGGSIAERLARTRSTPACPDGRYPVPPGDPAESPTQKAAAASAAALKRHP